MSERSNAVVEMRFETGDIINAWEALSLRDTYTDPLGELTFVARPPRARLNYYRELLTKGLIVGVSINGAAQGAYIVQTVNRVIGRSGVEFQVTCHTPLVTPYQGCANPDYSFSTDTDTPLVNVILDILSPYGFTTIIGDTAATVDAATGRPIGKRGKKSKIKTAPVKTNEARAQDNERALNFCNRLLNRYGLMLRMDGGDNVGVLLVVAPDYEQEPMATVVLDYVDRRVPVDGDRFEGDIMIQDTNDDQYSHARVRGMRPDKAGDTTAGEPVAEVRADFINSARPTYQSFAAPHKPLEVKDQSSRDQERAVSAAKLAMGSRAWKAFNISGRVDGFVAHTGRVWTVGTMVRVVVEEEKIDEPMFLYERVLTQGREGGRFTQLKLIPKDSLVLGDVPGN